jgi:hypothetical protein
MMLVAAKKKIEQCTRLYRNKEYTETGILVKARVPREIYGKVV